MVHFCGVVDPGSGDFPRSTIAFCCDAICISISALFGCSPVTAFIESGAGIAEGGRTGLTAMVTGLCFFVSVFFIPIFASIPPWATGCTLILVSQAVCYMLRYVPRLLTLAIGWLHDGSADNADQLAVYWRHPSFVRRNGICPVLVQRCLWSHCVSFCYYGPRLPTNDLYSGMFLYAAINGLVGLTVRISGGRLEPSGYDHKEYWTWKGPGRKPWFVRAIRNMGGKGKADDESSTHTFNIRGGSEAFERFEHDHKNAGTEGPIAVPLRALPRFPR